jgi:hypothetical protein
MIALLLFLAVSGSARAGFGPGISVRLLPPPLPRSDGETFFVATTGSDTAPGTVDQPWRTIQHAADTLAPGQIALVRDGSYT